MKVKAYAGDKIKMHRIAGTEKYGITFSGILVDVYSEEESRLILKKLKEIFIINLEDDKKNDEQMQIYNNTH